MRDDVVYKELAQVPVCCVVPDTHPFALKEVIHEKELLSENIIICNSYEIPSKAANIQNHMSNKFLPASTYYCENLQVIPALIKAGYGFALLPDKAFSDSGLAFVPLAGYPPISYGIFYKRNSKNTLIKKLFYFPRKCLRTAYSLTCTSMSKQQRKKRPASDKK